MIQKIKFYFRISKNDIDVDEFKFIGYSIYNIIGKDSSGRFNKYATDDREDEIDMFIECTEGELAGQTFGTKKLSVDKILKCYIKFENNLEYKEENYDIFTDYETFERYYKENNFNCIYNEFISQDGYDGDFKIEDIILNDIKKYLNRDSNNMIMLKHCR